MKSNKHLEYEHKKVSFYREETLKIKVEIYLPSYKNGRKTE